VRVPSSLSGLVGLKPTYGRDAACGGVENDYSCCNLGPLAGSVGDALLMYSVMSNAGAYSNNHPSTLMHTTTRIYGFALQHYDTLCYHVERSSRLSLFLHHHYCLVIVFAVLWLLLS
jgi:hypothetical protein